MPGSREGEAPATAHPPAKLGQPTIPLRRSGCAPPSVPRDIPVRAVPPTDSAIGPQQGCRTERLAAMIRPSERRRAQLLLTRPATFRTAEGRAMLEMSR